MADYIERKAVIDLITHRYENPEICTQEINGIHAADVVPVVRCKDCARYRMGACEKVYTDGNVFSAAWQERKPDDFCSYGEPKEG